MHDLTMSELVL